MSYYNIVATCSARVTSVEAANIILGRYMTIISDDDGLFVFHAVQKPNMENKFTLPLGRIIQLNDSELQIIAEMRREDPFYNYKDDLLEIFASRLADSNEDPAEVRDFVRECARQSTKSSFDALAETHPDCISVECDIAASGNVFNGYTLQLAGDVAITETYERQLGEQSEKFALTAQEKVVTIDPSRATGFDFSTIEDLLWRGLSEVGTSRTGLDFPSGHASDTHIACSLVVKCNEEILAVEFGNVIPAHFVKTGRKKRPKITASVICAGRCLWQGDDPVQLRDVINDWCSSVLGSGA